MKQKYSFDLNIAELPFRIGFDDERYFPYLNSSFKNFLGEIEKPYAYFHLHTGPKRKCLIREDSIKICRKNGHFDFMHTDSEKRLRKIGFIDSERNFCHLNIKPEAARILFHSFLASSCSFFLSNTYGFILHACGIIHQGSAYIFVGPSGSGKSTVASILEKEGVDIISDEKIVIRKVNSRFMAYAFPWYNDTNQSAPLKKIFFLKKGDKVTFRRLSYPDVVSQFFPNITFNLPDTELAKRLLNTLCLLAKIVPGYEMEFPKSNAFWKKIRDLK